MKHKFLVVLMAIATALCMAFGFTACGEKNPDETGKNPPITDPSGNQGEQGTQGGTQKPEESEQGGTQKPDEGEQEPETYTEGLFYSEMYGEDGTTVIGYSVGAGEAADEEEIVIPSKYNDLPVLSISRSEEDKAFWNKLYEELMKGGQDDFMQKLMQKYTFYNCENLKKITIPNSVTTIGEAAFEYSEKLASIYIPSSVTFINKTAAFFGCGGLTKIEVDPDNKGYHAKDNCLIETKSKILIAGCNTSKIPDDGSVTSIGISAFSGRIGLTSVTIPDSVTSIGDQAFRYCSGLKEVDLGHGVTSLGEGAFYQCSGLTSVTIPNNVTSIGERAFLACSGLTSITIPDSVTSIGDGAFADCEKLASITIPASVTSIGNEMFAGCKGLTSITIPNNVTSIGNEAFVGCYRLKDVELGHGVTSIGERAFAGCSGLTSITIPDSVTSIGERAFEGCSGLTSVTISDSVTSIGDGAFGNCDNLKNVHFETPNGWEAGSISLSGLNNPAQAAEYLTDTYCEYSWQRG